jgi:hypothetical protein
MGGTMGGSLAPGLAAIPDDLRVLHGGLAVIFSVSWISRRSSLDYRLSLLHIAHSALAAVSAEDSSRV